MTPAKKFQWKDQLAAKKVVKKDDDEDDFDDDDIEDEEADEQKPKKKEKESSDDDEEDFEEDEDDDEDGEPKKKVAAAPKLKPSNAGLLICSMRDTLKKKYLPDVREKIIDRVSWRDEEMTVGFLASINEYYPTNEKWLSL